VLVPGFGVSGLLAFILGPVVLSLVSTFLNKYFAERNVGVITGTKPIAEANPEA
jgi:putative membrane protein